MKDEITILAILKVDFLFTFYILVIIATPKPSQSSKFSLEGFIISTSPPQPSEPIWTRGIHARPGASKGPRDFKFDIKHQFQAEAKSQNLKISNLKISNSQNLKIYKSQNLKIYKSQNL